MLTLLASSACGKKGLPLPPEPRGPLAPREVRARQVGPTVEVQLIVSGPKGPKPAQTPVGVELLRIAYGPGLTPPQDPDAFRRRGVPVDSLESEELPAGMMVLRDTRLDEVAAAGVGWTLRYAVRVRDRRGRLSPLVLSEDLVPMEPVPPPDGLSAETMSHGIHLRWRTGSPGEEQRYNLYRSTPEGPAPTEPLNPAPLVVSDYLDRDISMGSRYRYFVRAVMSGAAPLRESASSAALDVLALDRFAPAAPGGLVAVQEGASVRLFWNPSAERDLAGYLIYRSVDGGAWTRVGPDPLEQPTWVDRDVRIGQRVSYRISAIDRATPPNESARSADVGLEVFEEPATGGADDGR